MHIAILGAGLAGCSASLNLANKGIKVTLFDRLPLPMSAASLHNEGKLHLGYVYAEDLLLKLGEEKQIKWTVLRGGFFMQNAFFMFKDSIQKSSSINFPNITCPMVDARDIGKCAARCLVSDPLLHHGKYYEINGPDRLTGPQIAQIFSNVLEREIEYNEMTRDIVRQVMPLPLVQIYEYIFEEGESAIPFTDDAKNLIGKLCSFGEFLSEFKKIFM